MNRKRRKSKKSTKRVVEVSDPKERSPEVEILSQSSKTPKTLEPTTNLSQDTPVFSQSESNQEEFPGASSQWPIFLSDEEDDKDVDEEKHKDVEKEKHEPEKKKEVRVINLWSSDDEDEDEIIEEIRRSEMKIACADGRE